MSDDTEFSGVTPRISYFTGIVVMIAAAVFGLFVNWAVALQGMDTGLFGVNPWLASTLGLGVVCVGIVWWRIGLRGVGVDSSIHRLGRWTAVLTFVVSSYASQHVLAASWKMVCDEDAPVVCYRLGVLVDGDDGLFDGTEAFETACRGGHLDACERLDDDR